jgi:hypothetical protein
VQANIKQMQQVNCNSLSNTKCTQAWACIILVPIAHNQLLVLVVLNFSFLSGIFLRNLQPPPLLTSICP